MGQATIGPSFITSQFKGSSVLSAPLESISLAANEYGFRVWSWEDTPFPDTTNDGSVLFSGGDLKTSFECNPSMITKVVGENKLRTYVEPKSPAPQGWCTNSYNMRAEIGTQPALNELPAGSENWFGLTYTFGSGYIPDTASKWLMWQNFDFESGITPIHSLGFKPANACCDADELIYANASDAGNITYIGTGVHPVAGQSIDVVVHIIFDDAVSGLVEIWVNDVKVIDHQARTVRADTNEGGHDKWGQYHSEWRNLSDVNASEALGITSMELFLGPIRQFVKSPSDPTNGDDERNTVKPR